MISYKAHGSFVVSLRLGLVLALSKFSVVVIGMEFLWEWYTMYLFINLVKIVCCC